MRTLTVAALALLLAGGAAPALAQPQASERQGSERQVSGLQGSERQASGLQASARCSAGRLRIRLGRVDAGAGNRYASLVFTNRSRSACTLKGYPGMVMIDGNGDALRTRVRRTAGSTPTVTLRPGRSAGATLHWTVVESGDESCPGAARLLVIPPGEWTYASIPFPADRVCGGGRIDVTPIR
jgi:hypothetical protein